MAIEQILIAHHFNNVAPFIGNVYTSTWNGNQLWHRYVLEYACCHFIVHPEIAIAYLSISLLSLEFSSRFLSSMSSPIRMELNGDKLAHIGRNK